MAMHQFTCFTNPLVPDLAGTLRTLKPQMALWVQFHQPVRCLKAEPALSCIFHAFANEVAFDRTQHIQGVAVIYKPEGIEHLTGDHRHPIFVSPKGLTWPSTLEQAKKAANRVQDRLKAAAGSTLFKFARIAICDAAALTDIVDLHDRLNTIDAPELMRLALHWPVGNCVTNKIDQLSSLTDDVEPTIAGNWRVKGGFAANNS